MAKVIGLWSEGRNKELSHTDGQGDYSWYCGTAAQRQGWPIAGRTTV